MVNKNLQKHSKGVDLAVYADTSYSLALLSVCSDSPQTVV